MRAPEQVSMMWQGQQGEPNKIYGNVQYVAPMPNSQAAMPQSSADQLGQYGHVNYMDNTWSWQGQQGDPHAFYGNT